MPVRHGIFVNEPVEGARDLVTVATGVIGLVATADDADADLFPLDQPALITDVRSAISQAGETGTLANALAAIADQASPIIVVARVDETVDPADQDDAVIGTIAGGAYSGVQALLAAEVQKRSEEHTSELQSH